VTCQGYTKDKARREKTQGVTNMSRGNSFGKLLSMTTYGESHGPATGVIIDGMPAGLEFSLDQLKSELKKRAPGQVPGTTSRFELDEPQVLSGIFENKTLGTPIHVMVQNQNQKSEDYENLKNEFRPGHADKTTLIKFGIRDHRGGGRASGRETLSRVIGGYFASLILPELKVFSFVNKMGPYEYQIRSINTDLELNRYHFPERQQEEEIEKFLLAAKSSGESYGGKILTIVKNCPAGLGEPVFDKLRADLAKGILSIGATTGINFGLYSDFSNKKGSEITHDHLSFSGIEGGISNGEMMIIETTFRPPSTVGQKAKDGRHDPCIVPRAVPVVNAMVKFILADHYLRQKVYQ
jgi:chorismate synthase